MYLGWTRYLYINNRQTTWSSKTRFFLIIGGMPLAMKIHCLNTKYIIRWVEAVYRKFGGEGHFYTTLFIR